MFVGRATSRTTRSVLAECRNLLLNARQKQQHLPIISKQFHSLRHSHNKGVVQVSLLRQSVLNTSSLQRFGFSSSASPQPNEQETSHTSNEQGNTVENNNAATEAGEGLKTSDQTEGSSSGAAKVHELNDEAGSDTEPDQNMSQSLKRKRRVAKRIAFSDSDSDLDLEDFSRDDLVKLVAEKDELLKVKHQESETLKDKVLRTYAEMENVMDRTRREAESSKKFAIQNFAKNLLDVADNLGRASLVTKESFSKIDASKDASGAVPLLKTLLEGVEMTEKQLAEVFKKFGMEKFDPTNEQFDPHRHNAVFQVPDPSKPPGTVAVVLKSGYMLYDRVIRPAEVGVTQAVDNETQ